MNMENDDISIDSIATERLMLQERDLAPPPYSGLPDNLLKAETKDAAISVTLKAPESLRSGDKIQLQVNGKPVGLALTIDRGYSPGELLTLSLRSEDRAKDQTSSFNYVITLATTGRSITGPADQTFRTKYTAPDLHNHYLNLAATYRLHDLLVANGAAYVHEQVRPYEGMDGADFIEILFDGKGVAFADAATNSVFGMTIPDSAMPLHDKVSVGFRVTDRAGNQGYSGTYDVVFLLDEYLEDFSGERWVVPESEWKQVKMLFLRDDSESGKELEYLSCGTLPENIALDPLGEMSGNCLEVGRAGYTGDRRLSLLLARLWREVRFTHSSVTNAKMEMILKAYRGSTQVDEKRFDRQNGTASMRQVWAPKSPADRLTIMFVGNGRGATRFYVDSISFLGLHYPS